MGSFTAGAQKKQRGAEERSDYAENARTNEGGKFSSCYPLFSDCIGISFLFIFLCVLHVHQIGFGMNERLSMVTHKPFCEVLGSSQIADFLVF